MHTTRSVILAACIAGLAGAASAQLVAYDGFDVAPRANLGGSTGGTGWTNAWQDLSSSLVTSVGNPGLTYPGLAAAPGAATTPPGYLPDLTEYLRGFPAVVGDTMYVSCLLRPNALFSNWYILRFGNYPMQVDLGVPLGYSSYGLSIGDGWNVTSNVPVVQGQTTLLVLQVQLDAAAHQTIYNLYVNPTIGAPQPVVPSATYSRGAPIALIGGIELRGEGGYTLDEIRIGSTWDSVLPLACYANCDNSTVAPILNVNDFVCFQGRFGAGDPMANCDGSTVPPVLNVNDFVCFMNRYAAGCP